VIRPSKSLEKFLSEPPLEMAHVLQATSRNSQRARQGSRPWFDGRNVLLTAIRKTGFAPWCRASLQEVHLKDFKRQERLIRDG